MEQKLEMLVVRRERWDFFMKGFTVNKIQMVFEQEGQMKSADGRYKPTGRNMLVLQKYVRKYRKNMWGGKNHFNAPRMKKTVYCLENSYIYLKGSVI